MISIEVKVRNGEFSPESAAALKAFLSEYLGGESIGVVINKSKSEKPHSVNVLIDCYGEQSANNLLVSTMNLVQIFFNLVLPVGGYKDFHFPTAKFRSLTIMVLAKYNINP